MLMTTIDPARELLKQLVEARDMDLKSLSLQLGRNHSYLFQYVTKGTPRALKEDDRKRLAKILRVPENVLKTGQWPDHDDFQVDVDFDEDTSNNVMVPEYDVTVSAGGGFVIDRETVKDYWPFSAQYIRSFLGIDPKNAVILEVRGDSMEPLLRTGDKIMVDLTDRNPAQPGIFCIWDSDATVVKRVEKIPAQDPPTLVLISENTMHGRYEVPAELTNIIGRVIWYARRM